MAKENHGLPATLTNEEGVKYNLVVDTYETLEKKNGYTKEEVDDWYEGHGDIVAFYGYESEDGDESARIGVEYADGRLCVYGCGADIENCTEEIFVGELTDPFYLS